MFFRKKPFIKKSFFSSKDSKAFSLIEILLVVSIISFFFLFALQKFSNQKKKIHTTFEKLVRLNRRLITSSKLFNKTYRLVIQLDDQKPETYWVEKKQAPQKIGNSAKKRSLRKKDTDNQNQDFTKDDSFFSKPAIIPPLLNITQIESPTWKKNKTEGLVYIYYYPKGFAQETAIQFLRTDNQARWTLYLDPVSKELRVLKQEKSLSKTGGFE